MKTLPGSIKDYCNTCRRRQTHPQLKNVCITSDCALQPYRLKAGQPASMRAAISTFCAACADECGPRCQLYAFKPKETADA